MHVTACLAGQKVDVEVGEDCRSLQALRECIIAALPQLHADGFDVSVGGRALNDEGIVSLEESVCLDVAANTRGLSLLALREAGREVSEARLFAAVSDGDVELCTLYLDAGVPLDCVDLRGDTPLHITCRNGHTGLAALLLDRGSAAIDEKNHAGETPLHLSCRHGYVGLATLLLDRGSNGIEEKSPNGNTPLHLACIWGHSDVAALLLDRNSIAIDVKGEHGCTPLHFSCSAGCAEIVRLLLDRGSAAIDETNDDGETPLRLACILEYLEVFALLLDRGCSVDVESYTGCDLCGKPFLELLSERGYIASHNASRAPAKRRRVGEQQ